MQMAVTRPYTLLEEELRSAQNIKEAAPILKSIGELVGLTYPACVDDYSKTRLLADEEGQVLAETFGWERSFMDDWVNNKLNLVDPLGAACRFSTKPFVWDAAAVTNMVETNSNAKWHLTPERGIQGGIYVPIHMPLCRLSAVNWVSRNQKTDLAAIFERYGTYLRMVSLVFMDLVYQSRQDDRPAKKVSHLTEREAECLTWVALGKTDGEIGQIINRSPTTARFHVERAVEKLGANNRTRAVAIAIELGLLNSVV